MTSKTPMTVILGYLEIMRVNGDPRQEMLGKVESTAHRVMELITQFLPWQSWRPGIQN